MEALFKVKIRAEYLGKLPVSWMDISDTICYQNLEKLVTYKGTNLTKRFKIS